jgi:hypothetical protein
MDIVINKEDGGKAEVRSENGVVVASGHRGSAIAYKHKSIAVAGEDGAATAVDYGVGFVASGRAHCGNNSIAAVVTGEAKVGDGGLAVAFLSGTANAHVGGLGYTRGSGKAIAADQGIAVAMSPGTSTASAGPNGILIFGYRTNNHTVINYKIGIICVDGESDEMVTYGLCPNVEYTLDAQFNIVEAHPTEADEKSRD